MLSAVKSVAARTKVIVEDTIIFDNRFELQDTLSISTHHQKRQKKPINMELNFLTMCHLYNQSTQHKILLQ